MKKIALPLVLLVLVALALYAFWSSLSDDGSPRGVGRPEVVERPAEAPTKPAEVVAADLPVDAAPDAALEAPPGAAGRQTAPAVEGNATIRGRVVLPLGAPADDTLRVVALRENRSGKDIYGEDGLLAHLAKGEREGVLGTAPVASDGTFHLDVASQKAWLTLDGKYLCSPGATAAAPGSEVVLTPELGALVTGQVRFPDGAELSDEDRAHFAMDLMPDGERLTINTVGLAQLFGRSSRLDAEGRFAFRAAPTAQVMQLATDFGGAAPYRQGGLELQPGREHTFEVTLQRGATLAGRVLDPGGAALAGAEVTANRPGMMGFPGDELASTESAEDGSFVLEHVAPGKVVVVASHGGMLESEAVALEPRDEERHEGLVLTLTEGARIAGRVLGTTGDPLPGVPVEVDFDPGALMGMGAVNAARGADGEATTDDAGRFTVAGLGKGPFRVRATFEQDGRTLRARESGIQPGTLDLVLRLALPSEVSGRVVDLAGAPVTRFVARAASPGPMAYMPGQSRQEKVADDEGRFTIDDLEDGPWKITIEAEGFGPSAPVELDLPLAKGSEPLLITLAPAATVTGLVLDPAGQPISGARVAPELELAAAIQSARNQGPSIEAHTDDQGRFELTGLGTGKHSISARANGFAPSEPTPVEVAAGQRVEDLVLTLRHGAVVTGEVYGPDGEPAGGVRIVAQGQGTMETLLERADGQGTFRLEHVRPGSWTITAILEAPDASGAEDDAQARFLENMRFTMIEVEDGAEEHVVLGAPPKAPVAVHGHVLHGGEPVGQGLVSFMPQGGKGFEALKLAPLDAAGAYRVELNEPGRYLVSVQVTGGGMQQQNVEHRVEIPETDDHTLDLELPLGGIRGRVLGPDGEPLVGAPVTLGSDEGLRSGTFMGGNYAQATTDAGGRYAFDYLRPGSYAVAAGGALFGGALGSETFGGRVVHAGLRVAEGEVLERVDFRLEKPGDLTGRVVDAGGAGVAGASVYVRDESGHTLDRFTMIASGPDGSFKYAGLAPGRYTASARLKDQASSESAAVRVDPGRPAEVTLVLAPGTMLLVEVLDDSGEACDATLTVVDDHGRPVQGLLGLTEMSRVMGEGLDPRLQRVGPLPPASYEVTAVGPDGSKASRSVTLAGQPERRLKLRLRD